MLPSFAVAGFLASCLVVFLAVNLFNWVRSNRKQKNTVLKAEVTLPTDYFLGLATLGTGVFFLECFLYIFLAAVGLNTIVEDSPLQLRFPLDSMVQLIGIAFTVSGYALFIWSVVVRGRYATSWEMPADHKLVTWGPYGYVRHPSYLAYFILFLGLLALLLNLMALIPLIAIPGYLRISALEEEMLRRRFGAAYSKYQRATGRFLPRRKRLR